MYGTRSSRRLAGALTLGGVLSAACIGIPASAFAGCNENDYAGSICSTAANYCPQGFLPLDGRSLTVADNQLLYAVIGCAYTYDNGNCVATFAIPDLRGRVAIGAGQGPGLSNYNRGAKTGAETVTMTVAQLPSHTHEAGFTPTSSSVTLYAYDGLGASPTPSSTDNSLQSVAANPFAAATNASLYGPGSGNAVELGGVDASFNGDVTVDDAGSGAPIPIVNPVMAVTYCMSNLPIFPPRN